MKNIIRITLFFSAFVIFSMNLTAQSLQLIDAIETVKGKTTDELHTYASVKNISMAPVNVKAKMEMVELFPGHSVSICIGTCYPPQITDFETPGSFTLNPDEVSNDFDFYANCYAFYDNPDEKKEGTSKIKFTLFNVADVNDKIEYICEFTIDNSLDVAVDAEQPAITVYPNPATELLNVDLSSFVSGSVLDLEIYDMLGNAVYNSRISSGNEIVSLKLGMFPAGNYLVRILENGVTKTVKPLSIVR